MLEIVGVVLLAASVALSWLVKRPVKCDEIKSVPEVVNQEVK